jgi:hypothetical protein
LLLPVLAKSVATACPSYLHFLGITVFPGKQIVSRPDTQLGVNPLNIDGAVQFRTE